MIQFAGLDQRPLFKMLKSSFSLVLLFVVSTVSAQIPHHDYFPASFCKAQGIRSVAVYRTKVDSLTKKTNPNKTIRLAKDAIRSWKFDSLGRKVKETELLPGQSNPQNEVTRVYENDKLIREGLEHSNTANAGMRTVVWKEVDYFTYDSESQCRHRVSFIVLGTEQVFLDSTTHTRDDQDRLIHEILRNNPRYSKEVYENKYTYASNKIEMRRFMDQYIINRDEYFLDSVGRILQEVNYPDTEKPALTTNYTYDASGRLIQLEYVHSSEYLRPAETVIRRTNSYDSKGKLVETRLQYADGHYELELYDYTLMSEE
jgi:hypothetical protein